MRGQHELNLIFPGRVVLLISRLIKCFGKFSEEIIMVTRAEQLNLHAINDSRSSFLTAKIQKGMMEKFSLEGSVPTCKVSVKSWMAAFKGVQNVDHMEMNLSGVSNQLQFRVHSKFGMVRTVTLGVEDCRPVEVQFDKAGMTSQLIAKPKLLLDMVGHLHRSLDAVSLSPLPDQLTLSSYQDDPRAMRGLKVQYDSVITIDANNFEQYDVHPRCGMLTFSFKEFRGILSFSEAAAQPISVGFTVSGQAIIFSVTSGYALTVDAVMATSAPQGAAAAAGGGGGGAVPLSSSTGSTPTSRAASPAPRGRLPQSASSRGSEAAEEETEDTDDEPPPRSAGRASSSSPAAAAVTRDRGGATPSPRYTPNSLATPGELPVVQGRVYCESENNSSMSLASHGSHGKRSTTSRRRNSSMLIDDEEDDGGEEEEEKEEEEDVGGGRQASDWGSHQPSSSFHHHMPSSSSNRHHVSDSDDGSDGCDDDEVIAGTPPTSSPPVPKKLKL